MRNWIEQHRIKEKYISCDEQWTKAKRNNKRANQCAHIRVSKKECEKKKSSNATRSMPQDDEDTSMESICNCSIKETIGVEEVKE